MKRPIRFLLFFVSISSLAQHIQWQQSLGGEREEHYYGTYKVKGYSIILYQERGEYDDPFPPRSHHVVGKANIKTNSKKQ